MTRKEINAALLKFQSDKREKLKLAVDEIMHVYACTQKAYTDKGCEPTNQAILHIPYGPEFQPLYDAVAERLKTTLNLYLHYQGEGGGSIRYKVCDYEKDESR